MTTTELSVVDSVAVVYGAVTDVQRYPDWLIGAKEILTVDATWPRIGSGFVHEVGVGPIRIRDHTTVTESTPGRSLRLIVRARPLLKADVRFEAIQVTTRTGTGTLLTMTEEPVGIFRWLAPVISPLVKVRNARSLQRLASVFALRPLPRPVETNDAGVSSDGGKNDGTNSDGPKSAATGIDERATG